MRDLEDPIAGAPLLARGLGRVVFAARWMVAVIYVGLLVAVSLLATLFVYKLVNSLPAVRANRSEETIQLVLQLVDIALMANLVLVVLFSGWSSILGPLPPAARAEFGLGFGAVKLRVIGAAATVAAVYILETYFHLEGMPNEQVIWQIAILLAIGVTAVLIALADRLSGRH